MIAPMIPVQFSANCSSNLLQKGDVFSFLGFILSWGESSNKKDDGKNVRIAPSDSGGALVNSKTKKVIGVHWGTWVKIATKYSLPSLSFMTSLKNDENFKFVQKNLGEVGRYSTKTFIKIGFLKYLPQARFIISNLLPPKTSFLYT